MYFSEQLLPNHASWLVKSAIGKRATSAHVSRRKYLAVNVLISCFTTKLSVLHVQFIESLRHHSREQAVVLGQVVGLHLQRPRLVQDVGPQPHHLLQVVRGIRGGLQVGRAAKGGANVAGVVAQRESRWGSHRLQCLVA